MVHIINYFYVLTLSTICDMVRNMCNVSRFIDIAFLSAFLSYSRLKMIEFLPENVLERYFSAKTNEGFPTHVYQQN